MFRHGDKVVDDLSAKGFKQMELKGKTTEIAGNRIKGYYSPWLRAEQSVETMASALAAEAVHPDFRKKLTREKSELDYKPFSEIGLKLFKEKGGVSWYYKLGDQRPDPDTLSPNELASRAATVLDSQIRMIGRLKDGSAINLANASHSPTMDVLLLRLMRDEFDKSPINAEGKDELEKMGGPLGTAEGFDVEAKTDNQGVLSAVLKFRGKELPVNLRKLRELAEEYQELGYGIENNSEAPE
ncbi:MAG: hypothetical protein ABIJ83_02835 [Patescibacteria group bacterium]